MTRANAQPVRQILADRGKTMVEIADQIQVDRSHFISAVRGLAYPRQEVRDRLPSLLDLPLEDLFEPERLARPYSGPRGRMGGRR